MRFRSGIVPKQLKTTYVSGPDAQKERTVNWSVNLVSFLLPLLSCMHTCSFIGSILRIALKTKKLKVIFIFSMSIPLDYY